MYSSAAAADSTREQLLDAAERLFADRGAHRASIRSITSAAGTNLAAVNYHFGSKEGLVKAVLARRLEPLNRRRLELLDTVAEVDGVPSIERIVRAFIEPPFEMVRRERGGHAFVRFLGRSLSDGDAAIQSLILAQFAEVIERFTAALARSLPHLGAAEIHWRFHFMVGAMIHTIGFGFLAHEASDGLCRPLDIEWLTSELVQFLAGGFTSTSLERGTA